MAGLAELGLLIGASYAAFRHRGNTLAESAAYAIMTTQMGLSTLFQLAFICGYPRACLAAELLWCILALRTCLKKGPYLSETRGAVQRFFRSHRWCCSVAAAAGGYLALQAVLIPPTATHWPALSRILLCERQAGFFADLIRANAAFDYPLNSLILVHHFLRFNTTIGLGIFSFLSYLSIALCTYSLARRYAWPATAATVALLVLSLPRFVLLSTAAGSELVSAAAAVFCLLVMYRVVEQPNFRDLLLLPLSLLFAISSESLYLALSAILAILAVVLLFRRHGASTWWGIVSAHRTWAALALIPAVIFSQGWRMLYAATSNGQACAALKVSGFAQNSDNLKGMIANLCRYLLESLDLTAPVDRLFEILTGSGPSAWLQALYQHVCAPFFAMAGAAGPFHIQTGLHEPTAWFGPLVFFLFWPSMIYAALRGPRRLKATAVALIAGLYLIALIPAWAPLNVRFFTALLACGGFLVAFLLPPWRLSTTRRHVFQALCLGLLCYAALCNSSKPVLGLQVIQHAGKSLLTGDMLAFRQESIQAAHQSVWYRWWRGDFSFDEARLVFGDRRLKQMSVTVAVDQKVAVFFNNSDHLYPFLMLWPQARAVCGNLGAQMTDNGVKIDEYDHVLVLGGNRFAGKSRFALSKHWQGSSPAFLFSSVP